MKRTTKTVIIITALLTAALLASCSLGLNNGSAQGFSGGKAQGADVFIESVPCFEYQGLSVTAKSLVHNTLGGKGVLLDIANDGMNTIGIGTSAVIVNGYMVDEDIANTIEAGKGCTKVVHLYTKALEAVGIRTVRTIEIHFYVYDSLSRETLYEADPVMISTSEALAAPDTPAPMTEIYGDDTFAVSGKYTAKSDYYGSGVLLRLDNLTDRRLIVSCDSMLVSGKPTSTALSAILYPGTSFYGALPMESGEDGVPIGTAQMKFSVRDALTGETIAETQLMSLEK